MKQFMVLCATLPIMLILMIQFSLDQRNAYKTEVINQIVYAASEEAKQNGCFTEESELHTVQSLKLLGFSSEDISIDYELDSEIHASDGIEGHMDGYIKRGYPIHYSLSVRFDKPMVGLMVRDNYYYYVINSYAASEY